MYQTVFISVVGVILVIKLVFLVAAVVFTLKYENQESRRGSVVSAATTTEVIDEDINITEDHSDGELGVTSSEEINVGAGGFEEQAGQHFEERAESKVHIERGIEDDTTEDHSDGDLGVTMSEEIIVGAGGFGEQAGQHSEERAESKFHIERRLEDDIAGIFKGNKGVNGLLTENSSGSFGVQTVRNLATQSNGNAIGKSIQYKEIKPNVSFFDAIMHSESYNAKAFYNDSPV